MCRLFSGVNVMTSKYRSSISNGNIASELRCATSAKYILFHRLSTKILNIY